MINRKIILFCAAAIFLSGAAFAWPSWLGGSERGAEIQLKQAASRIDDADRYFVAGRHRAAGEVYGAVKKFLEELQEEYGEDCPSHAAEMLNHCNERLNAVANASNARAAERAEAKAVKDAAKVERDAMKAAEVAAKKADKAKKVAEEKGTIESIVARNAAVNDARRAAKVAADAAANTEALANAKNKKDGAIAAEIPAEEVTSDAAENDEEEEMPDVPAMSPERFEEELKSAISLVNDGKLRQAVPILNGLYHEQPHNTTVRILMADACVRANNPEKALTALEGAATAAGSADELAVMLLRAAAHATLNQPYDAMLILDEAIKRFPKSPLPYYNLASVMLLTNSDNAAAQAEAFYRSAIGLGGARDKALEKRVGIELD